MQPLSFLFITRQLVYMSKNQPLFINPSISMGLKSYIPPILLLLTKLFCVSCFQQHSLLLILFLVSPFRRNRCAALLLVSSTSHRACQRLLQMHRFSYAHKTDTHQYSVRLSLRTFAFLSPLQALI